MYLTASKGSKGLSAQPGSKLQAPRPVARREMRVTFSRGKSNSFRETTSKEMSGARLDERSLAKLILGSDVDPPFSFTARCEDALGQR